MSYRIISADCHIDMTWMPGDLWVQNAPARLRDQVPQVRQTPDGPRWYAEEKELGVFGGLGFGFDRVQRGFSKHVEKMFEVGFYEGGPHPTTPELRLQDQELDGIDAEVMYGILGIGLRMQDRELIQAVYEIYNDWAADFVRPAPNRMKAAALLTLHDATLAAQELRRAVTESAFVAAQLMPNPVNGVNLHDPRMDPLWAEAERLNVPICLHPAPNNYSDTHFVNRYLTAPSTTMAGGLNNPVELMAAVASMTAGGVLERFPRMRVAFLEGNCSWLPWLLWRIDEYWKMSKSGETAKLQALPSEYFMRQCFISVDVDEDQVEWVIQRLGDDTLVFSTDYPHSDSHFPEATNLFLKLPLSEASKRKILWDNCARLYNVTGAA